MECNVAGTSAIQVVVAVSTIQDIISIPAEQAVVAGSTIQVVYCIGTQNCIIQTIAGTFGTQISRVVAIRRIEMIKKSQVLKIVTQGVLVVVSFDRVNAFVGVFDHNRVKSPADVAVVQLIGVVTRAAIKCVLAAIASQFIVSSASKKDVVVILAVEYVVAGVTNDRIAKFVAIAINSRGTSQRQVFKVGA